MTLTDDEKQAVKELLDRLCRDALREQYTAAIEHLDRRVARREAALVAAQKAGRVGYGEAQLAAQARVRRRRFTRRLERLA